jgi:hypothetical protein
MQAKSNSKLGSCGCGRSPTGDCCGWHALTEDEYKIKLDEYNKKMLTEDRPMYIWLKGSGNIL